LTAPAFAPPVANAHRLALCGAVWLAFCLGFCLGTAGEANASGREQLAERQSALAEALLARDDGPAFAVETLSRDGSARGDVYAILEHRFGDVQSALSDAASWCDIAPLHLNVKSCTHRAGAEQTQLTLYSGRKHYEPPEDAFELHYDFQLAAAAADYLRVELVAENGPFDSRDYLLELEAMPLGAHASFVHLGYAYRFGLGTKLALAGYFATRGSGKVGFSVVGETGAGDPVYVDGLPGLVERNAVRYQLAVEAYLDTLRAPEEQRFERRISRWFDLTRQHGRQLFELEEHEYIASKRRERSDQLRLQRALEQATLQP
jgi:hypothetical protein